MSSKRINVLVYTGEGTTSASLHHVFYTFRRLLSPTYVVRPVSADVLLQEPWQATCAALIIPGGADVPYCRSLNGKGNQRIKQFVQNGGYYIGLCAGGYYGTSRCEFMQGHPTMEVVGDRELGFFPGVCRGLAFDGFMYQSEEKARAAQLEINEKAFENVDEDTKDFKCYYNGGGVFVDAQKFSDRGVEVLANYSEALDCEAADGTAAVVLCRVGEGAALLTGPHPEFASVNIDRNRYGPVFKSAVDQMQQHDEARMVFLKSCLRKLGLKVNSTVQDVPSLSPLHLSSLEASQTVALVTKWGELSARTKNGSLLIKGENDIFDISDAPDGLILHAKADAEAVGRELSALQLQTADTESSYRDDGSIDYNKVVKTLKIHAEKLPTQRETPKFNHQGFYTHLQHYMGPHQEALTFGKHLLYAEVITSTSTLLEKNHSLLKTLPTGFTATASTQIAGRGRGSNVWVSPPGSLMFSTVVWHSMERSQKSPVVFVQYLAAMAVVRGTKAYAKFYDAMPLRLKWPNDVYAEHSTKDSEHDYVKVGGILVNSTYSNSEYGLVVGVGVNVANAGPTVGLDVLAKKLGLAPFEPERLLAAILTTFERLYLHFCSSGWDSELEHMYYDMWLHKDQIITIETEGNVRARIRGITRDWGLLYADVVNSGDDSTGRKIALQSDSNSFDFFRGLIQRKY